jgi:hypothetical protein
MTPSAQMSARASTLRVDLSCSGDMYVGDPITARVLVMLSPWVASSVTETFAMPKSSTLTRSDPSGCVTTKRFADFRSRWTMPSPCASAIASQVCVMKSTASATDSGPRRKSRCSRSSPSRYSITM